MLRVGTNIRHRDLMGAERPLDRLTVDFLGPRPALRRAQDDHGPAWSVDGAAARASRALRALDVVEGAIERPRHRAVDLPGVVARDDVWRVPVPLEEIDELVITDPVEHGRVGDLVAVEGEDRKHRTIGYRIEELVG